ncbi:MAG: hypothetical protein H8K10_17960 [Nitrospira sp.]|nr:hypothetical protein [Nitrospira sp.]
MIVTALEQNLFAVMGLGNGFIPKLAQTLDVSQALFLRLYSVLSPGERLISQDAFLHDREGSYPEEASLFAVSRLRSTPA